MDDSVLAAMARWPNVPAVTGWLSLTPTGQWHLHENGAALPVHPGSEPDRGSPITSTQIVQFIQRNYSHDTQGRWFFQNGPQRVYVRLDAAPLILRTTRNTTTGSLVLQAHTGQHVSRIDAWWLDDNGRLFAQTDLGPALVAGRDMAELLDHLETPDGRAFTDLELPGSGPGRTAPNTPTSTALGDHELIVRDHSGPAPLFYCTAAHIPQAMGFDPHPQA